MADRIQLNEQDLNDVVGGEFHYQYNRKGQFICKVDSMGVYYAAENAREKIHAYDVAHPELNEQELTKWALGAGYLSYTPF